ncbi:MAG: hypothetical protein GYB50_26785 [Rhodobacteraceae bacterium]|nr:hypothetical protein [Paracoccaceae bacterium]
MSINVYAWPPVTAIGSEWTEIAPVQASQSIITGADYLSAAQRIRRYATLQVSGIGRDLMSSGYIETLKKYLAGIHAVRLYSYPINWHLAALDQQGARSALPLLWTADGDDLEWTSGGADMLWYSGAIISGTTGTDARGFPSITVTGLPANTLIARPGEFLTVFEDEKDTTGTTVMIVAPATSDSSGEAEIRLFESPGAFTDARVNIGESDTAVFRPVGSYPRAVQQTAADWIYTWEFREVFADEVGGFEEIDPW